MNWFLYLAALFGLLFPLMFVADRVPYLQNWLFPKDLERGWELLNTNDRLSREVNQEEFEAVNDALQDKVPLSMRDLNIRRLAVEYQQGKKFIMAYAVNSEKRKPWHANQDSWNEGSAKGGEWWEMLMPYSTAQSSIEAQIESDSFPNIKAGVVFLILGTLFTVLSQVA